MTSTTVIKMADAVESSVAGVSVKMNVILYAPALLLLLLVRHGIIKTAAYISLCAGLQLALGLPFLVANPVGYIMRSFDLGRQFFFVWTVNWRFLPEWLFLNRYFHLLLLSLHVTTLVLFYTTRWRPSLAGARNMLFSATNLTPEMEHLKNNYIALTMFTSNLVGMCFARSLHYQFYSWYFHTLHFLLWNTRLPTVGKLLLLGVLELCWNTYPSTSLSSAALHACHALLLAALWWATGPPPPPARKGDVAAAKAHHQ